MAFLLAVFATLFLLYLAWVHTSHRIYIAPDTTFITSPLTPGGIPDFAAAINAKRAAPITADNNAAIDLLQLSGMNNIPTRYREIFAKLPGMPPAPPAGVRDYESFLLETGRIVEEPLPPNVYRVPPTPAMIEASACSSEPWTRAQYPDRAAWLAESANTLTRIHALAQKPYCYVPWTVPAGADPTWGFAEAVGYASGSAQFAASFLASDAMRSIGERDIPSFQRDLESLLKLARLVGAQPTAREYFTGTRLEIQAWQILQTAASLPDALTPAQSQSLLDFATAAGDPASPLPAIELGERLHMINMICQARNDAGPFERHLVPINYDAAMRTVNRYTTLAASAVSLPTYPQRRRALDDLCSQAAREGNFLTAGISSLILLPDYPARFPSLTAQQTEAQTARHLARIALALRLYRAKYDTYPPTLSSLSPDLLPDLPADPFIDAPFHYLAQSPGYLLYSIGPDLIDDHGQPRPTNQFPWPAAAGPLPRQTWDLTVHLPQQIPLVAPPSSAFNTFNF